MLYVVNLMSLVWGYDVLLKLIKQFKTHKFDSRDFVFSVNKTFSRPTRKNTKNNFKPAIEFNVLNFFLFNVLFIHIQ